MCGRYTITVTLEELLLYYGVEDVTGGYHLPRFNIAPGQMILAVVEDNQKERRIGQLKWGLVPSWAKDAKGGWRMINARSETLTEKPSFKTLLFRKRCVVPADGFYEWAKREDGSKQPMRIRLKSKQIFSMAGLYDTWIAPDGSRLNTCTIITTRPNEVVQPIHDRMPVILNEQQEKMWLDRHVQDRDTLLDLLQPYPADEMIAYPVSEKVGNVRNDDETLIEPIKMGSNGHF